MPLFQRDGEPILFNLINLTAVERALFTDLIKSEGGGITDDDDVVVKFTSESAYVRNGRLTRARLYDVRFVEECVIKKKIVEPENYRLDKRTKRDDYFVHHFLYGKCKDTRYAEQHQSTRQQDENVRPQSAYSMETLCDSDASGEQTTFVTCASTDGSQQVLSGAELEEFVSSLAGGDSAACHGSGQKRPCNLEYGVTFKPKEALHRIEECETEDVTSPLKMCIEPGKRDRRDEESRQWYKNPNRPIKKDRTANAEQESTESWKTVDTCDRFAVLSTIPENQSATRDASVTMPRTSQNGNSIEASNETIMKTERNGADRETDVPDLDPVTATDNHSKTVLSLNNTEELTGGTERKRRIGESEVHSKCGENGEKLVERGRKTFRNENVAGHRDGDPNIVETQGAKRVVRRSTTIRESLRAEDVLKDSSSSSETETTPSQVRVKDASFTNCSGSEISFDESSEDDGRAHRYERSNTETAGPSGARNRRRCPDEDGRVSNTGKSLVRNLAHPSFRTNPIPKDDESKESRGQRNAAEKVNRNQRWRMKVKKQTEGHYTGTTARLRFTGLERKTMVRYLVKNKYIGQAKGLVVWKKMILDGYLTDRTPQSLHNHFRKSILPHIEDAHWLTESDMRKFLALRIRSNQM